MRVFIPALLAIALSMAGNLAHASKFYRWTDADGVTHYTQTPPPEGVQSNEVRVTGDASSDQKEELKALEQRRQQATEQRQRAAEQQQEAGQQQQQPSPLSEEQCQQLRQNLQTLEEKPIVRQEDPETGEMVTLDAEARDKAMTDIREALDRCNQQ